MWINRRGELKLWFCWLYIYIYIYIYIYTKIINYIYIVYIHYIYIIYENKNNKLNVPKNYSNRNIIQNSDYVFFFRIITI